MKIKTLTDYPDQEALARQLEKLVETAFTEGVSWNYQAFISDFHSQFARYFLLEEDGNIIGLVNGHQLFDEFELFLLAIHPDFRKKGLATCLFQSMEDQLQRQKVQQILLEVRASNQRALKLYEQFSFERYHIRKNYYEQPVEDAWLLRKRVKEQTHG